MTSSKLLTLRVTIKIKKKKVFAMLLAAPGGLSSHAQSEGGWPTKIISIFILYGEPGHTDEGWGVMLLLYSKCSSVHLAGVLED